MGEKVGMVPVAAPKQEPLHKPDAGLRVRGERGCAASRGLCQNLSNRKIGLVAKTSASAVSLPRQILGMIDHQEVYVAAVAVAATHLFGGKDHGATRFVLGEGISEGAEPFDRICWDQPIGVFPGEVVGVVG